MGYCITSKGERFELEDKETLYLYYSDIIELNLIDNINLVQLYCHNNNLTQLNISNNIKLVYLKYDIKTNVIGSKRFLNNNNIIINQI